MQHLWDNRWRGRCLPLAVWVAMVLLLRCNNYGLLDKLENPGGSTNGETFANNYYVFVSSWTTLGAMGGSPFNECNFLATGLERADCAFKRAANSVTEASPTTSGQITETIFATIRIASIA